MKVALGFRKLPFLSLSGGLSLLWLCLLVLSVAWSFQSARWVSALPSLSLIALVGLGAGLVLGHLPGPWGLRFGTGLLVGLLVTLWQAVNLLPGAGWVEGLSQLWLRLGLWLRGQEGGVPDTLPFALIVIGLSWLLGYLSAWLVFPWRRGWLVVLLAGLVLLFGLFYGLREQTPYFFLFLMASLMLLMQLRLMQGPQTRSPFRLRFVHQVVLASLAVLLALGAWGFPLASSWLHGQDLWLRVRPWRDLVYGFERLFPMLAPPRATPPAQAGADWLSFGGDYPFQGERRPSQRPVFKVWAEWPAYWRATIYGSYTSEGWAEIKGKRLPLAEISPVAELAQRQELVQRVELLRASNLFFAAGRPLSVDRPAIAEVVPEGGDISALRPPTLLKVYQRYRVVSLVSVATTEQLRAAGTDYPAEVEERYLQLPKELPGEIGQLAQSLTQEAANPYDKALVLQRYLRRLPYRTDIPAPPPGEDGVSYFLFDIRAGYCDYYASAMVVMLRTLGIPARLAVGFASGQYDEVQGVFLVTENESHSWPEVFFPDYGWVEFEPTPIRDVIEHGSFPSPPVVRGEGAPPADLEELFDDFGLGGGVGPAIPPQSWAQRFSPWALLALAVLLSLPIYWWQRGLFRKRYEVQVYEKMCRLASLARLGHQPAQTPGEYAQSLALRLGAGTKDTMLIASAYTRRIYGEKGLEGLQRWEIAKAWSRLRRHMLKQVWRSLWLWRTPLC